MKLYLSVFLILMCCLCPSCFTGIESTPKIKFKEDNSPKNLSVLSDEQKILADIKNEQFDQWKPGKRFFVTNDKISLIFNSYNNNTPLSSSYIEYLYHKTSISVSGATATNIYFIHNSDTLTYTINTTPNDIANRKSFEIPFTVQQSLIDDIKEILLNNKYYIITSLVYDENNNNSTQQKFIPITITDINPGNHIYPIKISFKYDNGNIFHVYMTIDNDIQATRNFDTLFSLKNPRLNYPKISDKHWNFIINNSVIEGMNKDECRLALGAPQSTNQLPGNAGIIEIWVYSSGSQLLFEDGLLKEYKL